MTIALAFTWANYWALVAGILTGRVLKTIASYAMHPYRPRLSLVAWREIVGFSVWTWLVSMARMIRGRGVVMIIGGMLNPTHSVFSRSGRRSPRCRKPNSSARWAGSAFAGFAAARRSGLGVAETYMRIAASTLVIAMPASIGISAIAAPLVYLGFGAKWLEATPVIEILAISGVFAVDSPHQFQPVLCLGNLRPMFWNIVAISVAPVRPNGAVRLALWHRRRGNRLRR